MNPPVVIFDGVCNVCNSTVDFLLRHDRTASLLFVSFQDEKGAALLSRHDVFTAPDTVYVVENGVLYAESDAVIRLGRYVSFPWSLVRLGRFIPRPLRDGAYRWIARNRYRWFGKRSACRLPTPQEASRFL